MPVRLFVDGERPTAADLNRYFMQQVHALKTADESLTSSAVLQNDDHLFVPVDANTSYWVTAVIYYTAATTGDLKLAWTAPAGSTFDWVADGFGSGSTASGVDQVWRGYSSLATLTSVLGGNGTGLVLTVIPRGVLAVGGVAGTFQCQWSQGSSDVAATTVKAESILILRRLTS